MDAEQHRQRLRDGLTQIILSLNEYLAGRHHEEIREYLEKIEPGHVLPRWFIHLAETGRPERTDGKSLGTYVEKLLKAEITKYLGITITGSSASGVDIPELDLGTKATSDRQPQSSEPFDSPYDRVLGSKYDVIVCIYNGKDFFESRAGSLKILDAAYLKKTEVADKQLCGASRQLRKLINDGILDQRIGRRVLRSIVYAAKGGPKARLYKNLKEALGTENVRNVEDALRINEEEIFSEVEAALPNDSEWARFMSSPLEGKIGISFALQWRYSFRNVIE